MTMADLIALGAPALPAGRFYRVHSDADGFVYVQIREDRKRFGSRRLVRVIAPRTRDARDDVRMGCVRAFDEVARREVVDPYWPTIRELTGDHR